MGTRLSRTSGQFKTIDHASGIKVPGVGAGGTLLYELFRYVRPKGLRLFRRFGHK